MSVFKIALPNQDVKTASLADLVVDGRYPSPKINVKASPPHAGIIRLNWASSISIAYGTTRIIYSFPHGYNYIPTVFASHSFDNGSSRFNGTLPMQYGALGIVTIDADAVNINLKYFSTDLASVTTIPPFLMQVRFYVMAERGYQS